MPRHVQPIVGSRAMCRTAFRAQRELAASPESPALARAFLRDVTGEDHDSAVVDDAVLLVSELVTNSVLHGGPPVVVAVQCDGRGLQVRVRDGSTTPPAPRNASRTDEGGRGLQLVAALSSDWGVDATPDGKNVWFVLR